MNIYELFESMYKEFLNTLPLTFYIYTKEIRRNLIILTSHLLTKKITYIDYKDNITGINIEV